MSKADTREGRGGIELNFFNVYEGIFEEIWRFIEKLGFTPGPLRTSTPPPPGPTLERFPVADRKRTKFRSTAFVARSSWKTTYIVQPMSNSQL